MGFVAWYNTGAPRTCLPPGLVRPSGQDAFAITCTHAHGRTLAHTCTHTRTRVQMYRRGPHDPMLLKYNYGVVCAPWHARGGDGSCNQAEYGSATTPQYNVSRYSIPTTIFTGAWAMGGIARAGSRVRSCGVCCWRWCTTEVWCVHACGSQAGWTQ